MASAARRVGSANADRVATTASIRNSEHLSRICAIAHIVTLMMAHAFMAAGLGDGGPDEAVDVRVPHDFQHDLGPALQTMEAARLRDCQLPRNDPPTVPTVEKARVGAPGLAGDGVRNAWDTVLDAETRMAAAQVGPHPSGGDDDEPTTIACVLRRERAHHHGERGLAGPVDLPPAAFVAGDAAQARRHHPDQPFGDTRSARASTVRMGPSALVIIAPLIWGNGCRAIEPARFLRGFFDDVGLFGIRTRMGHAVLRRRAFAESGDHCRGHLFLVSSRRAAARQQF